MRKNRETEYVKIPTKNKTVWLKVKFNKKGTPLFNGKMKGVSLKSKKEYSFNPSEVIAFYTGTLKEVEGLGMPYIPTADVCTILDTIVPDSMGYETHIATRMIQEKIGKNLREFVAEKLHYKHGDVCKSLSAEQVDAVALAIYNIEYRKQGMIIGDQTGIGKGRVAGAMIRYGYYNGLKPIFLSEKPNLFSDLYRDLVDIDSENLKPFIVNGKESKTNIKDKEGNVVYKALPKTEQEKVFKDKKIPADCDFVCATYTQFNNPKKPLKRDFLRKVSKGNLIIMDESHNASGSSNTGEFLQEVLRGTKGVIFLSATFAKRPDNMPIYALKTSISDASLTKEDLINAIEKGGVALQEILASQLVAEGQMLRRERSFEGVEVNYFVLTEKEKEHKAIFDNITDVLRDIIKFQADFITSEVAELDAIASAEGKEIEERKGTSKAGVDNQPYFSKVFQVVNQMLFSLKARDVAYHSIERLKEGKKPIIAFSSTMESFIDQMEHDDGVPVNVGDTISIDYKVALQKGLDGVMRYTEIDVNGERTPKYFSVADLSDAGQKMYYEIQEKINNVTTGISLSPIDVIKDIVRKAGYTIDEVTGRKYEMQLIDGTNTAVLLRRKKILANDAFRMFNDNELDCLLINQSGSTGASAHAVPTKKVPPSEVKQRVMIVLQPELDINREIQKRGRINRTGQILKPIYDYYSSSIPAERRLMMMLRKKLKSLDANTTSNQKQSENMMQVDDFLNKYGDKVVVDYLKENPELNELIDDPLNLNKEDTNKGIEGGASKVSGRVAILKTEEQEKFYADIIEGYIDYVKYLKQTGKYDLEIEALNFEAETKEIKTIKQGKGGGSVFGENTYMEKVEVNNLKKPFTSLELDSLLKQSLGNKNAKEIQEEIIDEAKQFYANRLKLDIEDIHKKYDNLIQNISNEKKYLKIPPEHSQLRLNYIEDRTKELNNARELKIENTENKNSNHFRNIFRVLNFFYVGKFLYYPTFEENVSAVCLGININKKKNNPYTPSAIKVKIAISTSDKYIDLTISGEAGKKLDSVMAHSMNITYDEANILDDWDYFCEASNVNRKEVYIVTGNILQGFGDGTGKLISFTTKDGSIRKGILMPNNFDPVKNQQNFISVPIIKASDYILNLENGTKVYDTGKQINIFKTHFNDDRTFLLSVPASKKGQQYFKDTEIIKLCTNTRDGFERVSGQMNAFFTYSNMKKLIKHLSEKFNLAISLAPSVYEDNFPNEKVTVKTKTKEQEKAENVYEKDKANFEVRRAKKNKAQPKANVDMQKRIRIAKAKAIAKIKILKLRNR